MRVSFVIQDLFKQGAQRATALMARGFIAKGYDVDLIVSKVHLDIAANGGPHCFPVPSTTNWIYLPSRKARCNILELRRYLANTDAVAIVSMCSTYTMALAIASLAVKKRPRLYSVEHGITFALRHDWSKKPKPILFSQEWFKWLLIKRQFSGFMSVSRCIAEEYSRMYGISDVHVVYNPVDLSKGVCASDVSKSNVIISAGSFTDDKNHLLILKAIRLLHSKGEMSGKLIIYGDGPLRPKYEAYIKANGIGRYVELPGFNNNMMEAMSKSAGYVCSSRIESFAIAPVEAMSCGVPVVCCDCPCGPREILGGGKYGRLVPSGDVEKLADAIRDLFAHRVPVAPLEWYKRFCVELVTERYIEAMGLSSVMK